MPQRSGSASLPLHSGHVPAWLSGRMAKLGRVIVEAIVLEYGRAELLRRLAHPFWFQSFGAVMGMDWHSSGITTSVVGALKRGLAPIQRELGIYVCGGKGLKARRTPAELAAVGDSTGIDAQALATSSRLVAKIDAAAVQDGFDLYLHAFFVSIEGAWCVVQQGMNETLKEARRYHWQSENLDGFFDSPHSGIEGRNVGVIVNLADARAQHSRLASLELARTNPDRTLGVLRRWRESGNLALPLFPELEAAPPEPAASPGSRSVGSSRTNSRTGTGSTRSRVHRGRSMSMSHSAARSSPTATTPGGTSASGTASTAVRISASAVLSIMRQAAPPIPAGMPTRCPLTGPPCGISASRWLAESAMTALIGVPCLRESSLPPRGASRTPADGRPPRR